MTLYYDFSWDEGLEFESDSRECSKCKEIVGNDYISEYFDAQEDEDGYWVCDDCAKLPGTFHCEDDEEVVNVWTAA